MHSNRFGRHNLVTIALLLFVALFTAACGLSSRSTSAQANPRKPVPTQVPAKLAHSVKASTDTEAQHQPESTVALLEPTNPPATVQPDASEGEEAAAPTATPAPETPAQVQPESQVAVKPAAAPQPAPKKPEPPVRQKLAIPEPGPEYSLKVNIEGWTTYIYAYHKGRRHVVAEESTRHFPGMFEKYVALSPDNRTMTYATAPDPATDRMVMWTRNIDGSNKREVENLRW